MAKKTDEELRVESIKAATEYLKMRGLNILSVDQVSLITTSVAHGFYMGYREKEKELVDGNS